MTAEQNVVTCPRCRAETDLGPTGDDLSDTGYRLTCPVLHRHLIGKGGSDVDIECRYMQQAIVGAIIKRRRSGQLSSGGGPTAS